VRRASFARTAVDQVTVYVLLELERGIRSTRFFVARNSDLAVGCPVSPAADFQPIGFIDAKPVE